METGDKRISLLIFLLNLFHKLINAFFELVFKNIQCYMQLKKTMYAFNILSMFTHSSDSFSIS